MTRNSRHGRALIATAVCLTGLGLTRLAAQNSIHPPAGTAEGPIAIVVLADHFTASEEPAFNQAAENFLIHGLLADPDYDVHKSAFTIKTIFQPISGSTVSNYGFVLGANPATNCSLNWSPDTPTLIQDALPSNLKTAYVVVIGNHNYNFGCQYANWAYVALGAVGQRVLEHEFGHLLTGLYDEYEDGPTRPLDPIEWGNCSTNLAQPHWTGIPGVTNPQGCDRRATGIVRAFADCKMRSPRTRFCTVCAREMNTFVSCYGKAEPCNPPPKAPTGIRISGAGFFFAQQPTPPPPLANRSVQVLLRLNRRSRDITVLTASDVIGPVIVRSRRVGNYVYEITDNGKPIAVGVLTGDPFEIRGYRGGADQHARQSAEEAVVTVQIPQATRETIATRAIEINFYHLERQAGRGPITLDRFPAIRSEKQATPIARLPAETLRAFIAKR